MCSNRVNTQVPYTHPAKQHSQRQVPERRELTALEIVKLEHEAVCLIDITEDISSSIQAMFVAAESSLKVDYFLTLVFP